MDKPIKVIQGRYGLIRVYTSNKQATQEEFYDLLRCLMKALIRGTPDST
jgi:DNA-binding cell septation regulator SpoVG